MILKRLLMLCTFATLLTSCVSKIAMDKTNFYKNNKVGVVIIQDSISIYRQGAQGLLDMAISSGRKYKEPLKQIENSVNPKQSIQNVIETAFTENKKNYVILDEVVDTKNLQKFQAPTDSKEGVKFFKYDLRPYKEKLQIDELMIVKINYGLAISYYGMIETGKGFTTMLDTEIINLNNNQIIFREPYQNLTPIKGKWNTPPNYENMAEALKQSVDRATQEYYSKF